MPMYINILAIHPSESTFAMIFTMVIVLGCALFFTGIGFYAGRRTKPMWFWSGSTVSDDEITDIKAYNKANMRMWYVYSLPYWLSGIGLLFHIKFAIILMIIACTLGLVWLIYHYSRIFKKYKK